MIGFVIDESEFVLRAEEVGEEVGFPSVRLIGLYSDHDERCFYYIDSNTKEVLDMFPIKRSEPYGTGRIITKSNRIHGSPSAG